MKKLKNKLLFAVAPITASTISLVAVSCMQNEENKQKEKEVVQNKLNTNEFKVNFNDKKKELETFLQSFNFESLFGIFEKQERPKGLLKTYDLLFEKYNVFAMQIVKFVEGITKEMPETKAPLDQFINEINTNLASAEDLTVRRRYIDYLVDRIGVVFRQIQPERYKSQELIKEREALILILDNFNYELIWTILVVLEKLSLDVNKTYFDNKNENIDMFIKFIQEDYKKAENTSSVTNEQSQSLFERIGQFDRLFSSVFPMLLKNFKKGDGLVSYRILPNTGFVFDFEDLSTNGNDGILISPKEENKEQQNALISDVGILYIPNNENKLNRVNINFQAIINRYQNMLKDVETAITNARTNVDRISAKPEASRTDAEKMALIENNRILETSNASRTSLNNQINEYRKLWENFKNPTELKDNRLISSKLNAQNLTGKYILRITATFSPQNGQPLPVKNFAIDNIKINKETKKIEFSQYISDGLNTIVPDLYSRYIPAFASANEPFSINYYIPVDAKEFNEVFLGGKTPAEASMENNSLDLNIKKIVHVNSN